MRRAQELESSKPAHQPSHKPSHQLSHGPLSQQPAQRKSTPADGRPARDVAVDAVICVLKEGRAFEDAFAKSADRAGLVGRDRAFARAVAAAALRHRGSLEAVIGTFLDKPLPRDSGRINVILLCAAVQLMVLKTPPHAAISIAVDQTRADRKARRFDRLTNAVLRRVSERGGDVLAGLDRIALDVPAWMLERWTRFYGADLAREIARACLAEAALDITPKDARAAANWAARLGGRLLFSGTIRIPAGGRIEDLAGFSEGAWWVQDAAAALPVKVLGDVRGLDVADVCAAPGGKTAQLAALGARVVAIDQSQQRLVRLKENLARLHLTAGAAVADARQWQPGRQFDALIVDAPCTATGTMRRHPDILHLRRSEDVGQLVKIQKEILANAAGLLKPGGRLVYCTCSLENEEGPEQFAAFLSAHPEFSREPIDPALVGAEPAWLTPLGELRTLPQFLGQLEPGLKGMDGFYAALARKKA
ncbi:MAG TPA: RsmB/NOP family class I SAM-dependent RNA methyltransferase [Hyphomicrobium sp.]|nr:RsmB/NOP family class I SAM-dependent RNA methyltransferase [Hyphomicrobium sp.]